MCLPEIHDAARGVQPGEQLRLRGAGQLHERAELRWDAAVRFLRPQRLVLLRSPEPVRSSAWRSDLFLAFCSSVFRVHAVLCPLESSETSLLRPSAQHAGSAGANAEVII